MHAVGEGAVFLASQRNWFTASADSTVRKRKSIKIASISNLDLLPPRSARLESRCPAAGRFGLNSQLTET